MTFDNQQFHAHLQQRQIFMDGSAKLTFFLPDGIWEAELSHNQLKFVEEMYEQGKEVDFDYSGRFMYGEICPAVRVNDLNEVQTSAVVTHDDMGRGWVLYAKD